MKKLKYSVRSAIWEVGFRLFTNISSTHFHIIANLLPEHQIHQPLISGSIVLKSKWNLPFQVLMCKGPLAQDGEVTKFSVYISNLIKTCKKGSIQIELVKNRIIFSENFELFTKMLQSADLGRCRPTLSDFKLI